MVEDAITKIGEEVVKPRIEWSDVERKSAQVNAKTLNTIFASVDKKQFKLISTYTSSKKAWDILQTLHEGTSSVGISKSHMLTTQFEEFRMQEDDIVVVFSGKLRDIAIRPFILEQSI